MFSTLGLVPFINKKGENNYKMYFMLNWERDIYSILTKPCNFSIILSLVEARERPAEKKKKLCYLGYFSPDRIIWTYLITCLKYTASKSTCPIISSTHIFRSTTKVLTFWKKITKNHIVINLPKHSADVF